MPALTRRHFLAALGLAIAGLPWRRHGVALAHPGALPRLPPDNPQARALAYTEDATTATHPAYQTGRTCANCQFFTAESGACTVFPGFSVAPGGWCAAWAAGAAADGTTTMGHGHRMRRHMGAHPPPPGAP